VIDSRLRFRALLAVGAALALTAAFATTGDATVADTSPSNTAPPTVSGTAQQGETLTTSSGSWAGTTPMTFTYVWDRCDSGGSSCTPIPGETNQTYTLASSDVGHTLRSNVTASNSAGSASQLSAATATVTASSGPQNTSAPTVSGSAVVGATLTGSQGTWTGAGPITYAYAWRRCDTSGGNCSDISGTNSTHYVPSGSDVGHKLKFAVDATNSNGTTRVASSATDTITAGGPANTAAPKITGTPTQGQTLTVSNGSWSGTTPITYSYQWQRCDTSGNNCANIAAATKSTYTLTASDVGHDLRTVVAAKNSAGSSSATTTAVGPVGSSTPSGLTRLSDGEYSIPAANVASSDRLTVVSVKFSPSVSHARRPVTATFKVIDQNKYVVSGALVYAVGLPYSWMLKVPEARTGSNGQVTVSVVPTRFAPRRGALVMFVRARTPQGDLLAGSSTRRLIQLLLRP
jgi:hypothetical protein